MGHLYNPAFDGNVPRWRVQCGFECAGERCGVWGEWTQSPEGKKAREVGIYCKRHAREDGRTTHGRNSHLRKYVMTLSADDKKRAREDQTHDNKQKKKKTRGRSDERHRGVSKWLGSVAFEECSVFHSKMVLDELRVPPLLLGTSKNRTRVYLSNSFRLDDLRYLFEKRPSDNRQLFFVRGNSIIR